MATFNTPNCSFILSVEQGPLEAQAVLLVESLRRFGGAYANCPVYAISPRPARQIGAACAAALTALGAQTITLDLFPLNEAYGPIGRMAACAWAEQNLTSEVIVGLDDDLFFARPPDFDLTGCDFFARPVDTKGICTTGPNDPADAYWHQIAQLAGVHYDEIPTVETTVHQIRVKASYNGGMIAVRRALGLFQKTQEIFHLMRQTDLLPRQPDHEEVFASTGFVGMDATRWWGSSQSAFSVAVAQQKAVRRIAPATYNVPAHLLKFVVWHGGTITLNDAVLVHYHWLLDAAHVDKNPFVKKNSPLPPAVIDWLKSRIPLREHY